MLNDNIIVETGWPNERIIIIIVISCLFIYIGDNTGMGDRYPLGMHLLYVHFVGVRLNGMWPISAISDYYYMAYGCSRYNTSCDWLIVTEL